jgi:hypothetical protein
MDGRSWRWEFDGLLIYITLVSYWLFQASCPQEQYRSSESRTIARNNVIEELQGKDNGDWTLGQSDGTYEQRNLVRSSTSTV